MQKFVAFFIAVIAVAQQGLVAGNGIHADVRISAFSPSNKLMREIYGDWHANYEVEVGKFFYPNYELWGNVGYFSADGKTEALHTRTKFTNTNLSGGTKYIFCLGRCIQFQLGLGINVAFVDVHNDSDYVKRNDNQNGVGGVFKAGFYFIPSKNLFFEAFSDYLYQKIRFHKSIQIGGVRLGGGVGFRF